MCVLSQLIGSLSRLIRGGGGDGGGSRQAGRPEQGLFLTLPPADTDLSLANIDSTLQRTVCVSVCGQAVANLQPLLSPFCA